MQTFRLRAYKDVVIEAGSAVEAEAILVEEQEESGRPMPILRPNDYKVLGHARPQPITDVQRERATFVENAINHTEVCVTSGTYRDEPVLFICKVSKDREGNVYLEPISIVMEEHMLPHARDCQGDSLKDEEKK